jgi:hypothetical protein
MGSGPDLASATNPANDAGLALIAGGAADFTTAGSTSEPLGLATDSGAFAAIGEGSTAGFAFSETSLLVGLVLPGETIWPAGSSSRSGLAGGAVSIAATLRIDLAGFFSSGAALPVSAAFPVSPGEVVRFRVARPARGFAGVVVFFGFFIATVLANGVARLLCRVSVTFHPRNVI